MGISNLKKLIATFAEGTIHEDEAKNYFSRTIAFDGNMALYQFVTAMRNTGFDLSDAQGEITSHLQGLLYRNAKMIEMGIKPIFVFDGKPPQVKSDVLSKRRERSKKAKEEAEEAKEVGDEEARIKFTKQTARITKDQADDGKRLLRLMGIPVIEAPSEAEAQCAELVRGKLAYAVATEDMDALTFGAPRLLRHMTFSETRKEPILDFSLNEVLEGLDLTMDQFIDMCILCGCDYCGTIRGIGFNKAYKLMKEFETLEAVVKHAKTLKGCIVPDNFLEEAKVARTFFKEPEIIPAKDIPKFKFTDPDEEGLVDFLCKEKGFAENKVRKVCQRLRDARKKKPQGRLDSMLKLVKKAPPKKKPTTSSTTKKKSTAQSTSTKRKRDDSSSGQSKKRKYNF